MKHQQRQVEKHSGSQKSSSFFRNAIVQAKTETNTTGKREKYSSEDSANNSLFFKPTSSVFQRQESREREEKEKKAMQRKVDPAVSTDASLPSELQRKAEQVLKTNLSDVKINESKKATAIGALAYTQGNEITFAPGMYQPKTQKGRELIGHELTHVKQQREGRVKPTVQAKGIAINNDKCLEKEADDFGKKITDAGIADLDTENNRRYPLRNVSPTQEKTIQKYADRDNDGGDFLEIIIENGTYVLEAANIPCSVDWSLNAEDYSDIYGSASQYTPRHINGLNSSPQQRYGYGTKIRDSREPHSSDNNPFHIIKGPDLEPVAGKGSVRVDAYRHMSWESDEDVLSARIEFDTVPLVNINGDPEFVTGKAYDLDPGKHEYFAIAEGGVVTRTTSSSRTLTNGFAYTEGETITNTISSSLSSKIGADLEVASAEIGSQVTASEAIAESIQNSVSTSWSSTTSVSYTAGVRSEAGHYVILPTAKVWRIPARINVPDGTGKRMRTVSGYVYAIVYNAVASVLRTNESGTIIYDPSGDPLN